jgi:hypothetical protein
MLEPVVGSANGYAVADGALVSRVPRRWWYAGIGKEDRFMFTTGSIPTIMLRFAALAALLLFLGASGCGEPVLPAGWAGQDLTIDGKLGDWGSTLNYFEEQRVTLGVRNDQRYLYICVNSTDSGLLMRALVQGLEVWVDPSGGKAKSFGIRYPLGVREMDFDIGHEGRRFDPRDLARKYEGGPDELRVFTGPGESHLAKPGEGGIQVAMGRPENDLSCELRLPLSAREGEPNAIGARPGALLGIGFVIPEQGHGSFRRGLGSPSGGPSGRGDGGDGSQGDDGEGEGSGNGDLGGGQPGGGTGSEDGPRERGGRMGRGSMMSGPLGLWVKVPLAEGPTTNPNP